MANFNVTKVDQETAKIRFWCYRVKVVLVQGLVESYEGLGILRTVDNLEELEKTEIPDITKDSSRTDSNNKKKLVLLECLTTNDMVEDCKRCLTENAI